MTDPQYISKDWEARIERHIDTMGEACSEAQKHPPGTEFERLWETYEATCHDFLDHIAQHYGSPAGFASHLKAELTIKLNEAGLSLDYLEDNETWRVDIINLVQTAGRLSSLYRTNYRQIVDEIAHRKAFYHAEPIEGTTPRLLIQ